MYKKILLPIDINAQSSWDGCFPHVIDLAKAFDAKLYIMSVIPDYGMSLVQQYFPKGWVKDIIGKSKTELQKIIEKNVPSEIETESIVEQGAVYQCIIDKASDLEADLIVIPAHRPELSDYLLGPNAAKVVRHSKISVLVLRN
jgi:nucleotide-binding universal stress UspA family protein